MKQQIKVPSVGESISQATIGEWQKKTGDYVLQNEVLVVMETDKASMDLTSEVSGQLNILKQEGEDVKIGEVIAEIDTKASAPKNKKAPSAVKTNIPPTTSKSDSQTKPHSPVAPFPSDKELILSFKKDMTSESKSESESEITFSPAVRKLIKEYNLNPNLIQPTGPKGNITKADILSFLENPERKSLPEKETKNISPLNFPIAKPSNTSATTRKKMSTIRKKIAERLVYSQHSTATLTTFNEIDMSSVMSLRAQYKEAFQKKHNIKLGFMGFFIKACILALKTFPRVNAFIDEGDIIYNHCCHIGVAVSTDRGLVVPVIQNADQMTLPQIEQAVLFYAEKARDGKILPEDLMGGTFTISNGGVFGSLMSTPILNPPQSGILGMHTIEKRPVVIDSKIEIKPMMYVALSYDHRMVDGKESVSFLKTIKECVEDPIRLIIDI